MNVFSENVPLLVAAAAFVGVLLAILALMISLIMRNRLSRYELEHHRAVLSAMRDSYESQIARLAREMTATEQRWKDANHLLISAQKTPQQREVRNVTSNVGFLRGFRLSEPDLFVDEKLILVLTPFSAEEQEAFDTIQRTCAKAGFRCIRGDEEFTPSDILSHIVRLIVKARIVIANVSSRNPNVFYELGIAHALGKQTIIVSKGVDDVPFDVAGLRILIWHSYEELSSQLTQTLLRTVAEAREGT
jgi:hypothetical protein